MIEDKTYKRWAFDGALEATKYIRDDCLSLARKELAEAIDWLDRAVEAKAKREADEKAAAVLAQYTDLADAA